MANYTISVERTAVVRAGARGYRVTIGGTLLRWCLENPQGQPPTIPAPPDIAVASGLGLVAQDMMSPNWAALSQSGDDRLFVCFVVDAAGTATDPVPTLDDIAAALQA